MGKICVFNFRKFTIQDDDSGLFTTVVKIHHPAANKFNGAQLGDLCLIKGYVGIHIRPQLILNFL